MRFREENADPSAKGQSIAFLSAEAKILVKIDGKSSFPINFYEHPALTVQFQRPTQDKENTFTDSKISAHVRR